ncbi:hypothetical protein FACS189479_05310 [Spirochaetia bacterium]|nr:hypothetical protein FACS189479_05310 [Spirochaetia bacterium]
MSDEFSIDVEQDLAADKKTFDEAMNVLRQGNRDRAKELLQKIPTHKEAKAELEKITTQEFKEQAGLRQVLDRLNAAKSKMSDTRISVGFVELGKEFDTIAQQFRSLPGSFDVKAQIEECESYSRQCADKVRKDAAAAAEAARRSENKRRAKERLQAAGKAIRNIVLGVVIGGGSGAIIGVITVWVGRPLWGDGIGGGALHTVILVALTIASGVFGARLGGEFNGFVGFLGFFVGAAVGIFGIVLTGYALSYVGNAIVGFPSVFYIRSGTAGGAIICGGIGLFVGFVLCITNTKLRGGIIALVIITGLIFGISSIYKRSEVAVAKPVEISLTAEMITKLTDRNGPVIKGGVQVNFPCTNGAARIYRVAYTGDWMIISLIRTTGEHREINIAEPGQEKAFYVEDIQTKTRYPLRGYRKFDDQDSGAGIDLIFAAINTENFNVIEGNDKQGWHFMNVNTP